MPVLGCARVVQRDRNVSRYLDAAMPLLDGDAAQALDALRAESPDAKKIRAFLRRHAVESPYGLPSPTEPRAWERELLALALKFAAFRPLGEWETATTRERNEHEQRVARLSRELAQALNEAPRPDYPPVFALFGDREARAIIEALPEDVRRTITGTPYGLIQYERLPGGVGAALASLGVAAPQYMPALLHSLVAFAEASTRGRKRDARPTASSANARVFARELVNYFEGRYRRKAYGIVAACIALKFPGLDPPPTESDIRKWCRTA
jgi:hypothetical protein